MYIYIYAPYMYIYALFIIFFFLFNKYMRELNYK